MGNAKDGDAGQSSVSGGFRPVYRVLARKYRPATFADLVGQEPMVRTLTNAFRTGRIAQAYMLTGVRGVGKTTTARIIARALNHQLPDGPDIPSVSDKEGLHCGAILESRHIDVIEMDAASHTGIADIREIIESVAYKAVSARYKVYIIDEVHMLSNQAFNGLLKTLEEPPEHVKFIFATTEIRKVPVTILSRCQRFDLRRIGVEQLFRLMQSVLTSEGLEAEDEALMMIARASEGSARDSLSMLDQAIAHSGGRIKASDVMEMLGLADRGLVIRLFRAVMGGDISEALILLRTHYDNGADPVVLLSDLANFTHFVTQLKYIPATLSSPEFSELERSEGVVLADQLDVRVLSRTWQVLIKGIEETRGVAWSLAAAEMVLVRLAHISHLPTPDELIRRFMIESQATNSPGSAVADSLMMDAGIQPAVPQGRQKQVAELSGTRVQFHSFSDMLNHASKMRDLETKFALERYVRPVRIIPGCLEISLTDEAPSELPRRLSSRLMEWTGEPWVVSVLKEGGEATQHEKEKGLRDSLWQRALAHPDVKGLLAHFPGAELVDVQYSGESCAGSSRNGVTKGK